MKDIELDEINIPSKVHSLSTNLLLLKSNFILSKLNTNISNNKSVINTDKNILTNTYSMDNMSKDIGQLRDVDFIEEMLDSVTYEDDT